MFLTIFEILWTNNHENLTLLEILDLKSEIVDFEGHYRYESPQDSIKCHLAIEQGTWGSGVELQYCNASCLTPILAAKAK